MPDLRVARAFALVLAVVVAAGTACNQRRPSPPVPVPAPEWPPISPATRQALAAELTTVTLKNCALRRYGSANDGGYLMCENLTDNIGAAYSYGIDTEDNWGCDVSRQRGVVVHQYDCFTPHRPQCEGGRFDFHPDCVGPRHETIEGKPFDTLTAQIAQNGDAGKSLLVKIDIEGAEWGSLAATSNEVLDRFVQLPMELHLRQADEATILAGVRRLKQQFYLVNVHYNNWACNPAFAPLPAPAFQTLWVNKRVGVLDPAAPSPAPVSSLNAPDNPNAPECGR